MHHTTSGQTRRSKLKEEREWRDLQNQKIAYIKRLREDEERKLTLKNWKKIMEDEDDPTLPF